VKQIDVEQAARRLAEEQPPLLLDVRTAPEVGAASLEGAVMIPMQELPERIGELAAWKDRPILVLCHHGVRSLRVAAWLSSQGFGDVASVAGGIDAWSVRVDPAVPRY
jgi:rhodanese-related sulfurtransferase